MPDPAVKAIREALAAATPGEWRVHKDTYGGGVIVSDPNEVSRAFDALVTGQSSGATVAWREDGEPYTRPHDPPEHMEKVATLAMQIVYHLHWKGDELVEDTWRRMDQTVRERAKNLARQLFPHTKNIVGDSDLGVGVGDEQTLKNFEAICILHNRAAELVESLS